jgi:glycosyltransferase involved in cell wall biosynthesis
MEPRIKVLFVIPSLAGGGAERVMLMLLRHLNRARFAPVLLTLGEENDYPGELAPDIHVICLHKRSRWSFVRLCRDVAQTIRAEQPHLVVSFLTYANWICVIARWLCRTNVRVIISERGPVRHNLKAYRYYPLRLALTRLLHPRADGVITASPGVRDELVAYFGVRSERCFVVPNPVEIERIRAFAKEPVDPTFFKDGVSTIVYCGRLAPAKNLPLLLHAFNNVRERQSAQLLILGEGPERARLEALAKELGVSERVRFLGFQRNPFKYVAKATVSVLSSDWEGFGLVIPEAMVCGTPVIASDCPCGPAEIITHGENGLLFPPDNRQALADALVKTLQDTPLRMRLADAASQSVGRYDAEQIAREYEDILENMSHGHAKTNEPPAKRA